MNLHRETSLVTNQTCGGRTEQARPTSWPAFTLSTAAFVQCIDFASEYSEAKVI